MNKDKLQHKIDFLNHKAQTIGVSRKELCRLRKMAKLKELINWYKESEENS